VLIAAAHLSQMSGCRQFCATVAAVILTANLEACAVYRKCGLSGCPGDAQITAEVTAQFNHYPELEPPNLIHVQTLNRVVYLTGQLNTETERELAESLASHVAGVKRVVNSINMGYQGH
jgi:osmotically-inducible protein OsmY